MHFAIDLWYNNYAIISTYLCAMAVIECLNDQMQFDTVLQKKILKYGYITALPLFYHF